MKRSYLEESDGLSPENLSDTVLILALSVPLAPFRLINELSCKLLLLDLKVIRKILLFSSVISVMPLLFGVLFSTSLEFSFVSMSVYMITTLTLMLLFVATVYLDRKKFKALSVTERVMEEEPEELLATDTVTEETEENVMKLEVEKAEKQAADYSFDDPLMSYIGSMDELNSIGVSAVDYMAAGFKRDYVAAVTLDEPENTVGFDFNIEME